MKTTRTQKIFTLILAIVVTMTTFVFSQPAMAADSGELVKDKITWSVDDNGTLTISGTGAMPNYSLYSYYDKRPWQDYIYGIKNVVVSDGITNVGDYAFCDMTILKTVSLSNSINLIGKGAFEGCNNLSKVSTGKNITVIGAYAFSGCKALESFNFPENLVQINSHAFDKCSGLKIVTFGKELTTIGEYAFSGCTGLRVINIPESVSTIYSYAFENCTALQKIAIPEGVTEIGRETFKGCSNLATLYIPYSVKSVGYYAFNGCNSLKTIYYSGTEEQYQDIAIDDYNKPLTRLTPIYNTSAIPQYLPVLSTDIRSYLFESEIESYNVNGSTCVVAEDLVNYGFTVVWDGTIRTLTITHPSDNFTQTVKKDFGAKSGTIGEQLAETIPTDIITYINNEEIPAFNIGGKTVIYIDSLGVFGNVTWNPSVRSISVN